MLIIFDKDRTLMGGPVGRPPNTPDEQFPLRGVVKKLALMRRAGHRLAIASNQGGVAWGYITKAQAQALVKDAAAKVGGVDYWRCCCHDERAARLYPHDHYARKSYRRKPNPGMLKEIIRAAPNKTPENTIMVGDSDDDRRAAKAAGVSFVWAKDFFRWG